MSSVFCLFGFDGYPLSADKNYVPANIPKENRSFPMYSTSNVISYVVVNMALKELFQKYSWSFRQAIYPEPGDYPIHLNIQMLISAEENTDQGKLIEKQFSSYSMLLL